MRRFGEELRVTCASFLLLTLAAVLMLCQLAMWTARRQDAAEHSRRDVEPVALGNHVAHAGAAPRLRVHAVGAPHWPGEESKYYDPALAMDGDRLDSRSRYFVAMALEECYALSHAGLARLRDDFTRRLNTGLGVSAPDNNWARRRAFDSGVRDCVAFDGAPISPEQVLGLLQSAARDDDPRAIARTLLFRDLADSKVGSFDLVTRLLATGDPYVIRDIGIFLTRGESTLVIGDPATPVRASTLSVAWELAACDFGLDCSSESKLLNVLCAYQGQCGAFSYEDWLDRHTESREELAEIRRATQVVRRGLISHDWQLLGLSMLRQGPD